MEIKFTIHVSDDSAQHFHIIRKNLVPDGKLLPENERAASFGDWVNCEHFLHPGEVFEYFKRTDAHAAHIHIVDINCTEVDARPDVPQQFKKANSGFYTICFLVEKFNEDTYILPFTNYTDSEQNIKDLENLGLDNNYVPKASIATIEKVKTITKYNLLKSDQPALKQRVNKELRRCAQDLVSMFDEGVRIQFAGYAEYAKTVDWSTAILYLDPDFCFVYKMLMGWGDIRQMPAKEISHIIEQLLGDTEQAVLLEGMWDNKEVRQMLWEYRRDSHLFNEKKNELNMKAVDILLNMVCIGDKLRVSNENYFLEPANRLMDVSKDFKGPNIRKRFFDKMIARRVFIASSNMFAGRGDFDIPVQCSLLCYLQTEKPVIDRKTGARENRSTTWVGGAIKNYLGLRVFERKVPIQRSSIMGEEYNFYKRYIESGLLMDIHIFLDCFDIGMMTFLKEAIRKKYSRGFVDLSQFSNFVLDTLHLDSGSIPVLIDQIRRSAPDDVFTLLQMKIPVLRG